MFFFTPKSIKATLCFESSGFTSYAIFVETREDNSSPSIDGITASFCLSISKLNSSEEITAFIAPLFRMCRTKARVSISEIPTVSFVSIKDWSEPFAATREKPLENFFVIKPAILIELDSISSGFTP